MTTTTDTHKRGDSFSRLITIPPDLADGHFAGWTLAAQVRDANGNLLGDLACEWLDPLTTRELRVTAVNTTGWRVGRAELDVQFTRTADGWVQSTETHSFTVARDVTQPAPPPPP